MAGSFRSVKNALVARMIGLRSLFAGKQTRSARLSDWPTQNFFFDAKTAAEVEACLAQGKTVADLELATDRTPLHHAASWSPPGVVQALLHAGADIEARNTFGMTPLMDAVCCFGNHAETLAVLIESGASLSAEDDNHQNALALAAKHRDAEMINLLLEMGADPNSRLGDGKTPIFYAVDRTDTGPAQALIDGGANVNAVFPDASTPLRWAARFAWQEDMIELLVQSGADVDAVFQDGKTPLSEFYQNRTLVNKLDTQRFIQMVNLLTP